MQYDVKLLHKYIERKIIVSKEELQYLNKQLIQCTKQIIEKKDHQFKAKIAALDALSPLNTMKRGFSVGYNPEGHIIKQINDVKIGDKVDLIVTDGMIHCTVNQIEKGEENE